MCPRARAPPRTSRRYGVLSTQLGWEHATDNDAAMTAGEGVRYRVPEPWRHLRELSLRVTRWDLASVDLVSKSAYRTDIHRDPRIVNS